MAKFDFKLQSILRLKIQVEDNIKNELGKAVRKLEDEKNKLVALENSREIHIIEINEKTQKGITVEKVRGYSSYIGLLNKLMEKQKENINLAGKYVDKVREDLVKAVQEKDMLEKLKERKYQKFLKDQLKDEQRLNDEIVSFSLKHKAIEETNG